MQAAYVLTAHEVGHRLAELVRDNRDVSAVWVQGCRQYVDIWLHTKPLAREQELALYALENVLYDYFPDIDTRLHIAHAGLYDTEQFRFEPPSGTEFIPIPR